MCLCALILWQIYCESMRCMQIHRSRSCLSFIKGNFCNRTEKIPMCQNTIYHFFSCENLNQKLELPLLDTSSLFWLRVQLLRGLWSDSYSYVYACVAVLQVFHLHLFSGEERELHPDTENDWCTECNLWYNPKKQGKYRTVNMFFIIICCRYHHIAQHYPPNSCPFTPVFLCMWICPYNHTVAKHNVLFHSSCSSPVLYIQA